MYCFGDPAYGSSGWGSNYTSNAWLRQGYAGTLDQRVAYDDSENVMQSLGCHTVRAEIQPYDQGIDGMGTQANQRAQIDKGPGWDELGMRQGQTHWYGFAFKTNAGYVPHYGLYSGDWNFIMSFHNYPINGVWGPQAPVALAVSTEGLASGGTDWSYAPGTMVKLPAPRFSFQLHGGNQDDPLWYLKDGISDTHHYYLGPVFTPGHLYRIQFKITWGAHMDGAVQVWIDGAKYLDVSGVSNLWYSGSTVDAGTYPVFENYRAYDSSLPTNDVYYGGLITGSTQADVTVP